MQYEKTSGERQNGEKKLETSTDYPPYIWYYARYACNMRAHDGVGRMAVVVWLLNVASLCFFLSELIKLHRRWRARKKKEIGAH